MNEQKSKDNSAIQVVPDQKMIRMQDESMQAVAQLRPRQIVTIKNKCFEEIDAFPESAERYYYSIPHKTKDCDHAIGSSCSKCHYVEGASVHAAQAIQRYWGNCSSSWEVFSEDEKHIWIKGRFLDFETNTRWEKSFRASKIAKRYGKETVLNDRELTLAINAAGSKAQRNAILAGIPDPLATALWQRAKQLIVGDEPAKLLNEKQVKDVIAAFKQFGVDASVLERQLGKKQREWTMTDRAKLKGLKNALVDGATSEDVFGSEVAQSRPKPVETRPDHTDLSQAPPPDETPEAFEKDKMFEDD